MMLEKVRLSAASAHKAIFAGLMALLVSFSFSTALVEITFTFSLLCFIYLTFSLRANPLAGLPKAVAAALVLYTAAVLLSLVWTEYPKESFRGVFKVLQQVFIFLMAAHLPRETLSGKAFEKILLCLFAFVVANGLFQYALGTDLIRGFKSVDASAGVRITSSFKSYGLFASFLVLILPVVTALAFRAKRFSRYQLFLFILVAEGLLCLYFTRSRGAWLAFFLAAFSALALFRQWRFAGVLVLCALAAVAVLPKNVLIHLDADLKEQSVVERLELWQRAMHVVEAKPLTGTGINTYTKAHEKYDRSGSWRVRDYYAHNGYLQMAAEIGIPGAGAFAFFCLALLGSVFKRLKTLNLPDRLLCGGLWTGIAGFIIFAVWDTLLHNPQAVMAFWFVAGLAAVYLKDDSGGPQN